MVKESKLVEQFDAYFDCRVDSAVLVAVHAITNAAENLAKPYGITIKKTGILTVVLKIKQSLLLG